MVIAVVIENGIRIAVPTGIATMAALGAWIGNELTNESMDLGEGVTATPIKMNARELQQFEKEFSDILEQDLKDGGY